MKKTSQLRELINSSQLEFIMEAHNGLSAKIVEETGFKGVWASGLSISASLGVRDNNEASWTQILEVLEFMSDATNLPILMDGDTGFGNFNNARRLVRKLEQIGIAGVCIEDKKFPKTNSFLKNNEDSLADAQEFAGKISAMKAAQSDPDFVVVARLESMIAGIGVEDAIIRANAYVDAGADALLVHSKRADSKEIDEFVRRWDRETPIIIVPTKYYSVPTEHFSEQGISMIIWANHNVRACISAMRDISKQIYREESLLNVEDKIPTVAEIFKLQGNDELEEAEKRYLPSHQLSVNSIILAAAQGQELGAITTDLPKTLLPINGKSILQRQCDSLVQNGVENIVVVAGYKEEMIQLQGIQKVCNHDHDITKEVYSLIKAKEYVRDNVLISYGDLVYKGYVLRELLNTLGDIVLVADHDTKRAGTVYMKYIKADRPYSKYTVDSIANVTAITNVEDEEVTGAFIGLMLVRETVTKKVRDLLELLEETYDKSQIGRMDAFINLLLERQLDVKVLYVNSDAYLDVNTMTELYRAGEF